MQRQTVFMADSFFMIAIQTDLCTAMKSGDWHKQPAGQALLCCPDTMYGSCFSALVQIRFVPSGVFSICT